MVISSSKELKALREGGRILVSLMNQLVKAVEPGKNAKEIDTLARRLAKEAGVGIAFEGYQGFPAAVCVSCNEEVAHGVPWENKVFQEGDIVSLDFGIIHKELYTDHAVSFGLGTLTVEKQALIDVTRQALEVGIGNAHAGVRTGNIGFAIESFVRGKGAFGVVRRLVGHGIGQAIHEEPRIPNFGMRNTGALLRDGEVIAIEPMITLGSDDVILGPDNFTYKTFDDSPSAHFERTILVRKENAEIIT